MNKLMHFHRVTASATHHRNQRAQGRSYCTFVLVSFQTRIQFQFQRWPPSFFTKFVVHAAVAPARLRDGDLA